MDKIGDKQIPCVSIVMDSFERKTKEGKRLFVLRLDDGQSQLSPALFLKPDQIAPVVPPLTPIIASFRVVRGMDVKEPRIFFGQF